MPKSTKNIANDVVALKTKLLKTLIQKFAPQYPQMCLRNRFLRTHSLDITLNLNGSVVMSKRSI